MHPARWLADSLAIIALLLVLWLLVCLAPFMWLQEVWGPERSGLDR